MNWMSTSPNAAVLASRVKRLPCAPKSRKFIRYVPTNRSDWLANCLRFIRCRVLIEFMATNCVAVNKGSGAVIREGCIDREWILSCELLFAGHIDNGIDRLQQKRREPAATAGHGRFFQRRYCDRHDYIHSCHGRDRTGGDRDIDGWQLSVRSRYRPNDRATSGYRAADYVKNCRTGRPHKG
jgi:hypothetical protein